MTAQAEIPQDVAAGPGAPGALYAEVQQFYAHHMQLLDLGEAEQWADGFTEDAAFDVPTLQEPVTGRTALAASVRAARDRLAEAGEQHRHWLGMLDVQPQPGGSLQVRSYALVFATTKDGGDSGVSGDSASRVHRVCVCVDQLVWQQGRLLIAARKVTRDDLS